MTDSTSTTLALAVPDPALSARRQPNRASDPVKTQGMIMRRWQSPDVQKKVRLAKLIEDAYEQMPPDGDEELEEDGLGWVANVDWGGMNAGISDGVENDYNLVTQPDTYVRLVARNPKIQLANAMEVLERLHKEMVDSWADSETEVQTMLQHRRMLGLGIFHYPHPHGWHYRSLHPCNLVLPPRAKLSPETWPWFAIRTELQITDLLARLKDRKAATTVGWNVLEIVKAIKKYAQNGAAQLMGQLFSDPEGFIYNLAQNDLAFAAENAITMPGWTFYVREFDGKVSEYLLTDYNDIGWLYEGPRRHQNMADLIALFPLSLGQGYIERIRGYGVKMLPFHDLENRVLNHACDVTMIGAGMVLKSTNGDDFARMRDDVRLHGPITFVPEGIEVQQNSFSNPSAGVLGLRREFERVSNLRSRAFGGADYGQRESDETATAARLNYQGRTTVRSYEIARFYKQLSNHYRIQWLKMTDKEMTERDPGGPAYQAFLADAVELGVVAQDIAAIKRVVARTIFGDGDPNNQFLALQDLKEYVGRLPATGQRIMMRLAFRARLRDPELVDEMMGPDDPTQDTQFTAQRWRCEMEQNTFETSDTKIDLQNDDNHLIHAGEHTVYAEEVSQRVDEQALSEAEGLSKLMRCREHTLMHIGFLQADPLARAEFKDLTRRWADLTNTLSQWSQHLQAEQQRQQQQQLEELKNPKPSVKEQEIALTEQVKRESILAETRLKNQLAVEKHQKEMDVLARASTVREGIEMLKAANSIPNDTSKSDERTTGEN